MTKHQLEFQKREFESNIKDLEAQLERANKILQDKLEAGSNHTESNITHIENLTHKIECYYRQLDGVLKQLNETV